MYHENMTLSSVPRAAPIGSGPASLAETASRALAAACWVYAAGMALAFKLFDWKPATRDFLTDFVGVPVTAVALLLVAVLLFGGSRISGTQRRAWLAIGLFAAMNLLANEAWVRLPAIRIRALFTFADGLYLTDYWILTAAFALFFMSLGGPLRRPLVWLDLLTMTLVQLVGLWTLLMAPQVVAGVDRNASLAVIVAYSLSFAMMTSMATILWMQTRSHQDQTPMLLLIAAGWCEVTWEVMWLASWLADTDYAAYYYNFGDVLCFCCVASAASMTQSRVVRDLPVPHPERAIESFLPALAALLATAMVAASMASTGRSDAWLLAGVVCLCAALVLTRQRSVRRELQAMSTALALRESDARLTELVRRSVDLILVVDAAGSIGFVSPASLTMLGIAPGALQGARGSDVFGPDHSTSMQVFLDRLMSGGAPVNPIEVRYVKPDGVERTIKVGGANQLANPLIKGLALTLTDVSEQRSLEREVLDVATRERARLCGDIHDGLGQELVGIAMLLQGAATMPNPDPAVHKAHLQAIVGHVNRSIQIARDLARGLSPLHVVRGSLSGALHRLAHETGPRKPVNLSVGTDIGEHQLDDVAADHLYRIAQEAVINALSHGNCTHVDISLVVEESRLVMRIEDDGSGFDARSQDFPGLGLKLMEYRARLVGGIFRLETLPRSGTSITVRMPARKTGLAAAVDGQRSAVRGITAGGSP